MDYQYRENGVRNIYSNYNQMTMISVPQKFSDTLKSLHKELIWNGKRAKIKHSSLIGEYKDLRCGC